MVSRSLRFRLAARIGAGMTAALAAISVAGLLGARAFLDRELNASLLNVASIQAASVTDSPSGEMHFHEWDLTPDEAAQVRDLNRYAQVWNLAGESLLRTQYMTDDLPLDSAALSRTAAGELQLTEQRFQGLAIRSLYYPLERMGEEHARHVLQVAAPLTSRNEMLRQLAWLLLGITAATGLASFIGGRWLARRMLRPVHEIIDQAEVVGAQSLGRRIEARSDSQEYERLVAVLNTMLARLASSFDSQRRFTSDASHELRSPLTALRGEMELALRRERDPAEYRRVIASGLQEVGRLTHLTDDLLTLARSDAGVMTPRLEATDAIERIVAVCDRLRPDAQRKEITLRVDPEDPIVLAADAGLLDRLLWNLIDNAIKFTPERGEVTVRARLAETSQPAHAPGARSLVIEVEDSGPGVPEADRARIFDRFYRADEARTASGEVGGAGLGLSIVEAVAEAHGGQAMVFNRPEGGAVFRVELPLASPTSPA